MTIRHVTRRQHERRTRSGRLTIVREHVALYERDGEARKKSYRHPCPKCGAEIISTRVRNGGWLHCEGGKGLARVKHACLHMGERLSRKRDKDTLDLFETATKPKKV